MSRDPRVYLEDILESIRRINAYVNGIDDVSGSIAVGKLADLVVLDRNLFAIPAKEISETKVLLTLFGGKPVHGDLLD